MLSLFYLKAERLFPVKSEKRKVKALLTIHFSLFTFFGLFEEIEEKSGCRL